MRRIYSRESHQLPLRKVRRFSCNSSFSVAASDRVDVTTHDGHVFRCFFENSALRRPTSENTETDLNSCVCALQCAGVAPMRSDGQIVRGYQQENTPAESDASPAGSRAPTLCSDSYSQSTIPAAHPHSSDGAVQVANGACKKRRNCETDG